MSIKLTANNLKAELKAGVYPAMLDKVEERENDNGVFLYWTFTVSGTQKEVSIGRPTSKKFMPKSIPRQFAEALLGRKIDPGETIDTADLEGCGCQVLVTVETLDDGVSTVNRIEKVLAVQRDEHDVPF